jgi:glycosyltransferase 2 family protein
MDPLGPRPAPAGPMRWLRPALTLVSLCFVGWAAWDLGRRWQGSHVAVHWWPALLSPLPLVLGMPMQGVCWLRLIDRMSGTRVPRRPALALYFESQLARYLPGKLGLPLVRMAGASRLGVAASTVGSSVLVELFSWIGVGSVVGFGLLTATSQHARGVAALLGPAGPWLLGLSALGVLALLTLDRRRLPGLLLRLLRLGGSGPLVPPAVPLAHLGYWLTWAAHGVLVGLALGADLHAATASAGLIVLAPIVGFFLIAAPAGLGVREAVLSVGLAPAVGPAGAVAAAALSRAGSLLADVVAFAATRAWWRNPPPA